MIDQPSESCTHPLGDLPYTLGVIDWPSGTPTHPPLQNSSSPLEVIDQPSETPTTPDPGDSFQPWVWLTNLVRQLLTPPPWVIDWCDTPTHPNPWDPSPTLLGNDWFKLVWHLCIPPLGDPSLTPWECMTNLARHLPTPTLWGSFLSPLGWLTNLVSYPPHTLDGIFPPTPGVIVNLVRHLINPTLGVINECSEIHNHPSSLAYLPSTHGSDWPT